MDEDFAYFYNRLLDLTALGSTITKPFCLYIIIAKTPKYMRTVSYFILSELGWIFIANFLYTLGHPLPMMPAVCFRLDGMVASLLKTEEQRAMYFGAIAFTVVNSCLSFLTTFFYRYVSLAFPETTARIHKAWGFLCCVVLNAVASIIVVFLFHIWWLPSSQYPGGEVPENMPNIFCYKPEGVQIVLNAYFCYAVFGIVTIFVVLLGGLCVRELWVKKNTMSKTTLFLQKEVVKNLLIITGSAMSIGSLPLMVVSYRKAVVDLARSMRQAFKRVIQPRPEKAASITLFNHVKCVKY
uniref:G_PROTEIN_RECEP_F1_2 domain-containing protein n=1 Tax=Steinernema glaseri TaxID=37863 RepID=A0A1I7YZD7_9BILA